MGKHVLWREKLLKIKSYKMRRVIRDPTSCIELAPRPVCIGTQLEQNRIKHSRCRGATFGQKLRLKGRP